MRIEDYALIGDCHTAALVGRDGSIDWLCLPRFDSGACFARLLGDAENGRWLIAPEEPVRKVTRRYVDDSLVLETTFETERGAVTVVDCMPIDSPLRTVVRLVRGVRGRVRMRLELAFRFDYGVTVPWVRKLEGVLVAVAGPNLVRIDSAAPLQGEGFTTVASFDVEAGMRMPFALTWTESHKPTPEPIDAEQAIVRTTRWWQEWASRCTYHGPHEALVRRSLLTIKALTYAPTGGIVAAPTTSLPEEIGGQRNWDYRYCWLRDATVSLLALIQTGYHEEALAFREWLARAVAGKPSQLQVVFGCAGERMLPERELSVLTGYEGSRPVRIGNKASEQLQLDIFGEVLASLYLGRVHFPAYSRHAKNFDLERTLADYLLTIWRDSDRGIWELRGEPRQLTHSKVMVWVAFDRAIKAAKMFGFDAPVENWKRTCDDIHAFVDSTCWSARHGAYVQYPGADHTDASLLLMAHTGFLPVSDSRLKGTVELVEKTLLHGGFVRRYPAGKKVDGLPGVEGVFLPCSFWLVDNYALMDRVKEAEELLGRLVGLANDVGLFAEEYDPVAGRMIGNFPQGFTHVAFVNAAIILQQGASEHIGTVKK